MTYKSINIDGHVVKIEITKRVIRGKKEIYDASAKCPIKDCPNARNSFGSFNNDNANDSMNKVMMKVRKHYNDKHKNNN